MIVRIVAILIVIIVVVVVNNNNDSNVSNKYSDDSNIRFPCSGSVHTLRALTVRARNPKRVLN